MSRIQKIRPKKSDDVDIDECDECQETSQSDNQDEKSNVNKAKPVLRYNLNNGRRYKATSNTEKKTKRINKICEEPQERTERDDDEVREDTTKTNKQVKSKREKKVKKPPGLWIVTLQENGYMKKGDAFKPCPKKETEEYKKLREIFDEKKIALAKKKPI